MCVRERYSEDGRVEDSGAEASRQKSRSEAHKENSGLHINKPDFELHKESRV